jgi:hypothetical protein
LGTEIDRERFDAGDYARFAARLEDSLEALARLLARPGFGEGPRSLGAELELFLVDAEGGPLPLNEAVLRETVDPRITVELDRFNLECNLRPTPLAGRPFSALAREIDDALAELRRAAAVHRGRIALIGILPTLRVGDLQPSAMTDSPRYRALSAALQRLRREPFRVRIDGADPLDISCEAVTFEGANTSLQIHLRLPPREFADVYNSAQLATALALAASGNSPTFLGHRLWEETRIALFKQAVDQRGSGRGRVPRVGLGTGWVREGAWELFAESVALHEPLLPVLSEQDPLDCVRSGGVPSLHEMRLHQGTVWGWNRALYDPAEGGHLRIEMRGLPAGPTRPDMLASAAFLVGLAFGLAPDAKRWTREVPFALAEHNFYRAAQSGLDAELAWPTAAGPPAPLPARELVARLLPLARTGLARVGVDPQESEPLLELVSARVASGRTGSAWQRAALDRLEPRLGRERGISRMLQRYLEHAETQRPVHEWPLEEGGGRIRVLEVTGPLPASPEAFLRTLGGPSLLRLPGRDRSRTRAVSTLLHGNEPSGLRAVHAYLRSGAVPAVDSVFFLGAVEAALAPPGFAHRQLPGAADLNRCFRPPRGGPEGELAREALALLREVSPEALLDLHNNSGHSPAYGVGPRAGAAELEIVSFFADRYVHSDLALGALVEVTASWFPSVVLECGRAGDAAADALALGGLTRFLGAAALGARPAPPVEIFGEPVRVQLRPGARLAVGTARDAKADLTLSEDVDRHNFELLEPGHCLGWIAPPAALPVEARDAGGRDRAPELLADVDGELRTRVPLVPIMMTTDPAIAAQDCLFYAVFPAPRNRS